MQKYLELVPPNLHLLLTGRLWDREMGVSRPFGSGRMTESASCTSHGITGALVIIRNAGFAHSSNKKNTSKMPVCREELSCSWRDPCLGSKCIFMPGSVAEAGPGCHCFASFMFFSFSSLYFPCWAGASPDRACVRGERARAGTCWLLELVGRWCLVLGVMESGRRLESATVNTSN